MVKNPLKKIKVKKVSEEKASSEAFDFEDVKMKTPSKIKKSKTNGVSSKTPCTEIQTEKHENGFTAKPPQQQQRQQLPHGAGNLRKRLRDESKFISDVLEFIS